MLKIESDFPYRSSLRIETMIKTEVSECTTKIGKVLSVHYVIDFSTIQMVIINSDGLFKTGPF